MDFIETTGVVWCRQKTTILGRPTNVVGGICGLQMENNSNDLLKENNTGGMTRNSGGH